MKYIKALFDIQRVHVDGSSLFYEVYYLVGKSYVKLTEQRFTRIDAAKDYIDELLEEV